MEIPGAIFAYFGAETVLPLTSVVVAVLGVALLFGRPAAQFLAQQFRPQGPGPVRDRAPGRPHFARGRRQGSRSPTSGSERADA
jgi:hypothetical protein